ncbi:DEKNAAC105071 [Brettanomyces naardenensis]|uniref:DEKNAAC105071 n=1 Tax=Brettanomyces naardenensis TaxID=13370 RepID=A0A448YSE0_BRENA|nr:DEKNAAC105071 [Brettanomyces naardenensis]
MSQKPGDPTPEIGDKEAAGLLMLFSNQSQRFPRTSLPPQQSPAFPAPIPANELLQQPQQPSSVPAQYVQPKSEPQPNQSPSAQSEDKDISGNVAAENPDGDATSIPMRKQNTPLSLPFIEPELQHVTSPGPAAAALASGSGSNNKAIVAAAALAAAAATPLPLLSKNHPDTVDIVSVQNEQHDLKEWKKRTHSQEEAIATAASIAQHMESIQRGKLSPEYGERLKRQKVDDAERQVREHNLGKRVNLGKSHHRKESSGSTPSYAVDPDAGVIGCICGYDHDDGFTIQCDRCFRWQHAVCMGISNIDDAPEKYLCYLCDRTHHIDAERARRIQEARLKPLQSGSLQGIQGKGPQLKEEEIDEKPRKKTPQEERLALKRYETFFLNISHYEYASRPTMSLLKRLPKLVAKKGGVLTFKGIDELNRRLVKPSTVLVRIPPDNPRSKFTGIARIGLRATKPLAEGQLISSMYGELQLKQDYLEEKTNKYWIWGCCKPNAFFHPHLPIVIDERSVGNITRFTRKSCHPNCEIKTAILGDRRCVFVLGTCKEITAGEELTLPWEWDENHPIHEIEEKVSNFEKMDNYARTKLMNSIHAITNIASCACTNTSTCLIDKISRLTSTVIRKNKGQSVISPTPNQTYDPIEDRYKIRQEIIEKAQKAHEDQVLNGPVINPTDVVDSSGSMVSKEENNQEVDLNFTHIPLRSMLQMPVVPSKYEIMKQYFARPRSAVVQGAVVENLPLYTPFPLKAEELSKLVIKRAAQATIATPQDRVTSSVKKANQPYPKRPKIVKKFSLADYKRKTKGNLTDGK